MQPENIFEAIPQDLTQEVFEILAQSPVQSLDQSSAVKIERIISHGHASPASGWYDQEENEWIILLKGRAIICFEDTNLRKTKEIKLETGCYLNIPAHSRHRVKWTEPDTETIWLAVHY